MKTIKIPKRLHKDLKGYTDQITAAKMAMDHHAEILRARTGSMWEYLEAEIPEVNIGLGMRLHRHTKEIVFND